MRDSQSGKGTYEGSSTETGPTPVGRLGLDGLVRRLGRRLDGLFWVSHVDELMLLLCM
jgi:hypothetical protein